MHIYIYMYTHNGKVPHYGHVKGHKGLPRYTEVYNISQAQGSSNARGPFWEGALAVVKSSCGTSGEVFLICVTALNSERVVEQGPEPLAGFSHPGTKGATLEQSGIALNEPEARHQGTRPQGLVAQGVQNAMRPDMGLSGFPRWCTCSK